jgi:CheY-like chemotaxis protein
MKTESSAAECESDMDLPTILMVDDEKSNCDLIRACFPSEKYTVVIARTGREALDRLAQVKPDVIFTDLCIPEMGGVEFIRRLRKCPNGQMVTVIILTGNPGGPLGCEAVMSGANLVLSKPVDVNVLRSAVTSAINLKRLIEGRF